MSGTKEAYARRISEPEESHQLKRDGLICLLITELQLLRVCNPLARSAGVFLSLFEGFGGVWTDVVCHFKKYKEIWNIYQGFKTF